MWRITRDYLHESDPKTYDDNAVGEGYGKATMPEALTPTDRPKRFRLYDDYGILCYEGEACNLDPMNHGSEPLDWAMIHYAGCAEIRYWEKDPKTGLYSWRTI